MLNNHDPVATIAVKDLAAAGKFYEEKVGLERVENNGDEAITFRSGNAKIFVYRSTFAGTNRATAVTWSVGNDIDAIVQKLKTNGISFERYDMPGMKLEGDLHVADGMKAAWFKDPDGNILGLVSG